MGMCDPKDIRNGTPWYLAVNQPGFTQGQVSGKVIKPAPSPASHRDNTSSKQRSESATNDRS